ncbi:MAG: hypothetical protein IPL25_19145 [Saprospiraceae bacterium]|nr:hypothetical protein [Candidatus Vicinibacter affinis]
MTTAALTPYDNNGNILSLNRNANLSGTENIMDNMQYYYYNRTGGIFNPTINNPIHATNRLAYVTDLDVNNNYDPDGAGPNLAPDIQSQNSGNYNFDASGNLISDAAEEIANIEWTTYGKIKRIIRATGSSRPELEFEYDAMGNRIGKVVKPRPGGILSLPADWIYTSYALDAKGNPMAIYDLKKAPSGITLYLKEQAIYGSSRIGIHLQKGSYLIASTTISGISKPLAWTSGLTLYELSNHLGNVMTTISDRQLTEPGPATGLGNIVQYFLN